MIEARIGLHEMKNLIWNNKKFTIIPIECELGDHVRLYTDDMSKTVKVRFIEHILMYSGMECWLIGW